MATSIWLLAVILALGTLAYHHAPLKWWTGALAAALVSLSLFTETSALVQTLLWVGFAAWAIAFNLPSVRLPYITRPVLAAYRKIMPSMSQTEQEALAAGTVWWEGELFSGKPNWQRLLSIPKPVLSAEEQAFMDTEVETLCGMINDWEITHVNADLGDDIWNYLKSNGFFSLIIPKHYGGKEFSALAHSEILAKVSMKSATVASTIAVPNSLGPAELLLHYGTEEQKNHYLPGLASGREIPCFALTSPEAGSDAGAIPDTGIVTKGTWEGKEIIGLSLTWDKRYITLAPVATVLGLAFKMSDPDGLLGEPQDYGITCALIPTNTPGVEIGRRHFPLNVPFQNGPTRGNQVFVPLDYIIGGAKMAGQGWRMLVECLSCGRAISLPSSNAGATRGLAVVTGAYARIRKQFRLAIGKMEGVEEALARIGGNAYICEAARTFTAGAVDLGEKPSVPSAIVKYAVTERARDAINDAMDVHGGKGIMMGPNNYLGRGYQGIPVSITVEGANILTRSMIIFGQGAVRCHPYVLKEMVAANETDAKRSLHDFDQALFGHIGFAISNVARSFTLALTGGRLTKAPAGATKAYYQQLTRISASYALLVDSCMGVLGASLKRKEKISGRLADVVSALYLGSAVLKRYEEQGRQKGDLPLVHWAMQSLVHQAHIAMDGIIRNLPNAPVALVLRGLIFPLGIRAQAPSDALGHQVAKLLITPSDARERFKVNTFIADVEHNTPGFMETVFKNTVVAEPILKRIENAVKSGQLQGGSVTEQIQQALAAKMISEGEADLLQRTEEGRKQVIAVDDFDPEALKSAQAAKPRSRRNSKASKGAAA